MQAMSDHSTQGYRTILQVHKQNMYLVLNIMDGSLESLFSHMQLALNTV